MLGVAANSPMARKKPHGTRNVNCTLTLEDEFTLTRIRAKAQSLTNQTDRDNYFWTTVFKLVCRERAYKAVMETAGIHIDTNMNLFDDETAEAKED